MDIYAYLLLLQIIALIQLLSQSMNIERKDLQAYPEYNLSNQLLQHHHELLTFLHYTNYDIIYETFQLKHGSYSERKGGHFVEKFKNEEVSKHYEIISEKMHLRILRDDIDLDKHLAKLQLLWHNRNIPFFHRYYFLKYLFTSYFKNISPAVFKQQQLIRSEEHIYFHLFKSINARQACLRNLKKGLAQLKPQDVYEFLHIAKERLFNEKRKIQREKYKLKGYKLKLAQQTKEGKTSKTKLQLFSDSFNHLTKLTLYVIEYIIKWKDYITSLTHDIRKQKERMEYYFYDQNYFLKILTDLGFLRVSFLAQFYSFSPKNDPFLLEPILMFEKKAQKSVENELLKMIFMPQRQQLADILLKLEFLSQEYRYNIRSRKVYDLNVLKKPLLRADQKQFNNQKNQQNSNLILKKIESPPPPINKKSKSVSTFRIKEHGSSLKKQKIVIEYNKKESPLRKKLLTIPAKQDKEFLDMDKNSPFKNSTIFSKNENMHNNRQLVNAELLDILKKQVIKKVREDFDLKNFDATNEKKKNQALEVYINNKVAETMKTIFPFQPQKLGKQPIEFTLRTIKEMHIAGQVQGIFKHSLPDYHEMQMNQTELIKLIQSEEYVYILTAKIGDEQIGKVVCCLESEIKEFKVLKIVYIHFPNLSELELIMLQFVKYLWKYQNAFQIHFRFLQPSNHQPINTILQNMENTLEKECIFARKQIYSSIVQLKLIFKRQTKNISFIPNNHPYCLHLEFRFLFSHKKLMLENRNENKHLQLLHYDYFLMQVIKRFLNSQDILMLKEKIAWRSRLKYIIDLIKEEEESELMSEAIHQIQANNISELNSQLTKLHQPYMEVSDLVKTNHVNLITLQLTFRPNYPIKSLYRQNNQQYHRFAIKDKSIIQIDQDQTQFFVLKLQKTQQFQLVIFNGKHYHATVKEDKSSCLSLYLNERLNKGQHGMKIIQRFIENLWIPMARYPHKYKDREQNFYHTTRVLDLSAIKFDTLIGQKLQWFGSMQMQNSISYDDHKDDIIVSHPYGVAIRSIPSKTIIYSRIFL